MENKSPSTYYDKRLINICQVPQMPYLEMVNGKWRPTQKAIKAVEDGKLFLEKNGQTYIMHYESFLEEKTVENEEIELSKEEFDRLSNLLGNATDSEGQDFKAKFDAKNQDTKQIVASLLHETREPEEAYALSPSYFDFESEEKDGDGYDMRWDLYENIATKILSDKAIISMEQVEILIEEESFRLEEKYNKEHNITQKQEYQKEEQYEQEWPGLASWKELADVVGKDIYVYKDNVLENNEGISEKEWKTEALARILNDGILDLRGFDTESTSKINSLQYDNDFMKTIKGEVYKAINPEKWDVLTKLAEDTVDEYSPEIVGLTVDTLQIRYDEKLSEDHVYLEAVEKGLVEIDKNMAERILDNNNPRLLEDGVKIAIVKASFEKDTPEWEKPERFIVTPQNSFAENYIDKELADYLTDNRINSTEPKISEKQAGIISYYLMRNEYALYTDKKGNLNCVDFSEDFNTENIDVMTNKDLLKLTMDLINKDIGFKDRAEEDLKEIQAVFNDYEQTQKIQQTQSVQELYDSFIGKVEKEFKELKLLRAATINTIKTLLPEDKKIINEELKKRGAKTPESLALVVKESIEKRNKNKTRKQSQNKEKDYFSKENAFLTNTLIPKFGLKGDDGKIRIIEGAVFKKQLLDEKDPSANKILLEIPKEDGTSEEIKISEFKYQEIINGIERLNKFKEEMGNKQTLGDWFKAHADYNQALLLDEFKLRENTAGNFIHNFKARCLLDARNRDEAIKIAARMVKDMDSKERKLFNKDRKEKGAEEFDNILIDIFDEIHAQKELAIKDVDIFYDVSLSNNSLERGLAEENRDLNEMKTGDLIPGCEKFKVGDTVPISITTKGFDGKQRKTPKADFKIARVSKNVNPPRALIFNEKTKAMYLISLTDLKNHLKKVERIQLKDRNKIAEKDYKQVGYDGLRKI